jgi:hypothetical protein
MREHSLRPFIHFMDCAESDWFGELAVWRFRESPALQSNRWILYS